MTKDCPTKEPKIKDLQIKKLRMEYPQILTHSLISTIFFILKLNLSGLILILS